MKFTIETCRRLILTYPQLQVLYKSELQDMSAFIISVQLRKPEDC